MIGRVFGRGAGLSGGVLALMITELVLVGCGSSSPVQKQPPGASGSGGSGAGHGGSGGASATGGTSAEAGAGAADSGGANSGSGGSTPGSGGSLGASGGSAGTSGTGSSVDTSETSMPDAELVGSGGEITDADGEVVESNGADWLAVLSSHYYLESDDGGQPVGRWLGLVENVGPLLLCGGVVHPRFYDGGGDLLLDVGVAPIFAPTYARPGVDSPSLCLAAGDRAISSVLVYDAVDPSEVAEVRYTVSGFTNGEAEPKSWVTVEDEEAVNGGGGKIVRGTLHNGEVELSWWRVHVFGLGTDGVPLAGQTLTDGELGIAPGTEWGFESEPFVGEDFTDFRTAVEHSGPR
jgi:hypothetical protein